MSEPTTTTADQTPADQEGLDAGPARPRKALMVAAAIAAVLELAIAAAGWLGAPWATSTLTGGLVLIVVVTGTWLTVIDVRTRLLPNRITYPLGIVVAAGSLAIAISSHDVTRLGWSVVGAGSLGAFYLVLGIVGGIGLGDIKLAVILGAWLGTAGWEPLIVATVTSYLLALPQTLIVLAGTRTLRSSIAFGPYLLGGAILAVLGTQLLPGTALHLW